MLVKGGCTTGVTFDFQVKYKVGELQLSKWSYILQGGPLLVVN